MNYNTAIIHAAAQPLAELFPHAVQAQQANGQALPKLAEVETSLREPRQTRPCRSPRRLAPTTWNGLANGTLVYKTFVQAHFPNPDEYRGFINDYLRTRALPDDLRRYLESLDE